VTDFLAEWIVKKVVLSYICFCISCFSYFFSSFGLVDSSICPLVDFGFSLVFKRDKSRTIAK